jgi:drug/metabolite transporter (DMT)-like permease
LTAGPLIDRVGIAAAMTTVVLWASGYVGIRALATELSPGAIAIGRLLVAVVILALLVLRRRTWVPMTRRDLGLVVGSGVFWYALYFVVLNQAEQTVDAGTAAMLVNTGPIFVALLAGLFLGEGFPGRLLIGSAVAFGGSVIIGLATRAEAPASAGDPTLGIVLCLVAAAAYATGVTLQKPALRRVPALQLTFVAVLTATIVTLPFGPDLLRELTSTKLENTLWIIQLGVFPTAIAFTTWSIALSRMPAGRLAALTYLVPPIVVVMGWAILGEVPPALAIAGGALCVGGVIVARSSGGRPRLPTRAQPTPGKPAEPTSP